MTALEHIRRRSKAVAWAMLPLLVVAWLNGASACVGMLGGDPVAHGSPHHPLHDRAADLANGGFDDAAASEHAPHDHGDCPHCPTSPADGELARGHTACEVADGTAVNAASNPVLQFDLKPILSPIAWIAPVAATAPSRMGHIAAQSVPAPLPRPLNVQYCVFLL